MQNAGRNKWFIAGCDATLEIFWRPIVGEAARRIERRGRRRFAIGDAVEIKAAAGGIDRDRARSTRVRQILIVDTDAVVVSKLVLIHGNLPHRALKGEVSARGICSDRKERQDIARAGDQATERHRLDGAAAINEIIGKAAAGIAEIVVIVDRKTSEICRGEFSLNRRISASNTCEGNSAKRKGIG